MEIVDHPSRFFWTFGNHENLPMYRRIGKVSTGGVQGSALWLEKWHNWYDSEECADRMADLGLNLLHCRCYKGMGWEYEKEDFPRVQAFAERCRKRGITVLAYVQYATLYHEIMRKELPNVEDWAAIDYNGKPYDYNGQYWRWMPCPNRPGFVEYIQKVLKTIIESGSFDGVMFDNMVDFPCYCPDCRKKFIKHIEKKNWDFLYPEFVSMPPPDRMGDEVMDPVAIELIRMRHESIHDAFMSFRKTIKSINPDAIVTGNFPMLPRRHCYIYGSNIASALGTTLDFTLGQSASNPGLDGTNSVVSQIYAYKLAHSLHTKVVPLVDSDAGGPAGSGSAKGNDIYVAALCESLFNNSIPVDRIVMKPMRGGALDENVVERRRPILKRIQEIAKKYESLLELPEYAPVGLVYAEDSTGFSKASSEAFLRCQESLLRAHVPYRLIFVKGDFIDEKEMNSCSTLILPDVRCMSDKVIEAVKSYKGDLVLAGSENGGYDENYCQRAELPFADTPARSVEITPHDVSKAIYYKFQIFYEKDNYAELFPTEAKIEMDTVAHAVFKQRPDGKIPGVFISAVTRIPGGKLTLPEKFRTGEYEFVTIDGAVPAVFDGDTIELPAFEGMIMLCEKQ